jgi:hypothetical protein
VLARRQDLPEEAFVSVEELILQFGDSNVDNVLPIVVISFCWDRPGHPDPKGKQLATVAEALEREMAKYGKAWVSHAPRRQTFLAPPGTVRH